jgi:8-oxo-dGTP diphosphatase
MNDVSMALRNHEIHSTRTRRMPRSGLPPGRDTILRLSLCCNLVSVLGMLYVSLTLNDSRVNESMLSDATVTGRIVGYDQTWHGGHPAEDRRGSCWCGAADQYCMCTPNLAIDLIITSSSKAVAVNGRQETSGAEDFVWLVRRKDTDQLATMGGFVDLEETVEQAVMRELKEEMGVQLTIPPKLVGVYSDPRRDIRRRTASAVFAVHLSEDFYPQPGDDAKEIVKVPIEDIEKHSYFADHRTILLDYRSSLIGETPYESTKGDFANDIIRSTCSTA